MIYLKLFLSFVQVGLFSVGGGYAALPLIQNAVVDSTGWLGMGEFTDLVTIAEMTPGPIAVNAATFVGIRIGGSLGAFAATLGCIAPSCVIVSLLAVIYSRWKRFSMLQSVLASLRPAVVALITSAGLSIFRVVAIGEKGPDIIGIALFAAAFFALRRFKLGPIPTIAMCGAAGLILRLIFGL